MRFCNFTETEVYHTLFCISVKWVDLSRCCDFIFVKGSIFLRQVRCLFRCSLMCTVDSSGCILRACSALFAASDEADWYDPASYHVRSVLCSRCPKPLDLAWVQDSIQVQPAHHPAEDQERGQVDVNEKNTSLLGCDV